VTRTPVGKIAFKSRKWLQAIRRVLDFARPTILFNAEWAMTKSPNDTALAKEMD
jgi:hypothetical protein